MVAVASLWSTGLKMGANYGIYRYQQQTIRDFLSQKKSRDKSPFGAFVVNDVGGELGFTIVRRRGELVNAIVDGWGELEFSVG